MVVIYRENGVLYVEAKMELRFPMVIKGVTYKKQEDVTFEDVDVVYSILERNGRVLIKNGEIFKRMSLGEFADILTKKDYKLVEGIPKPKETTVDRSVLGEVKWLDKDKKEKLKELEGSASSPVDLNKMRDEEKYGKEPSKEEFQEDIKKAEEILNKFTEDTTKKIIEEQIVVKEEVKTASVEQPKQEQQNHNNNNNNKKRNKDRQYNNNKQQPAKEESKVVENKKGDDK